MFSGRGQKALDIYLKNSFKNLHHRKIIKILKQIFHVESLKKSYEEND